MSLRVWLPLNGDLHNQGISNAVITNSAATINSAGKIGSCYSFAKNAYLDINKETMQDFNNAISICFWIKINSWNTNWDTIFQAGKGGTAWTQYHIGILRNSANYLCWTLGDGSTASNANYQTGNITVGQWTHVACTYGEGQWATYLNGTLSKSGTTTIVPNFSNITSIKIGGLAGAYKCDCLLNDVRIYDHCLSAAEVKEIAQGLVVHYKLDASSEEKTTIIPSTNVYSYPTFNTSTAGGGWNHWGPSGHSGSYGQNTDKKYIYNKNNTYSHWITEDAGTGKYYLLYQSPAFEGGYRSLQAIIKEENNLPITESICYPDWNARNGGAPNYKWTTIKSLGDDFYYCCCEGVSQDGSNDLIGIIVQPGYKIYVSECYLENNTEACSPIFTYSSNIVQDSSGYNNNGEVTTNFSSVIQTPRYIEALYFNGINNYIKVPYNVVCPDNIFTCNVWFKKEAIGSKNYETIFGGPSGFEMDVRSGAATSLSFYMAGTRSSNRNSVTPLTFGEWFMLTMVRDGTKERYYVNGIFQSEIDAKPMPTGNYYIGAWSSTTSQNYEGLLSDFRLYNTPLLDTDIKQLYNVSMKVDNLHNVHTEEVIETGSNIWTRENLLKYRKSGNSAQEIFYKNDKSYIKTWPAQYYQNITINGTTSSCVLYHEFKPNTQYIFDMWMDSSESTSQGGFYIYYTDGTSSTALLIPANGNEEWVHKQYISDSGKTILRMSQRYGTNTPICTSLDSYIGPLDTFQIKKTAQIKATTFSEDSSIAKIFKSGYLKSSQLIER